MLTNFFSNKNLFLQHPISILQSTTLGASFFCRNSTTCLITGAAGTLFGLYGLMETAKNLYNGERDVKQFALGALSLTSLIVGACTIYSAATDSELTTDDLDQKATDLIKSAAKVNDISERFDKMQVETTKAANIVEHSRHKDDIENIFEKLKEIDELHKQKMKFIDEMNSRKLMVNLMIQSIRHGNLELNYNLNQIESSPFLLTQENLNEIDQVYLDFINWNLKILETCNEHKSLINGIKEKFYNPDKPRYLIKDSSLLEEEQTQLLPIEIRLRQELIGFMKRQIERGNFKLSYDIEALKNQGLFSTITTKEIDQLYLSFVKWFMEILKSCESEKGILRKYLENKVKLDGNNIYNIP